LPSRAARGAYRLSTSTHPRNSRRSSTQNHGFSPRARRARGRFSFARYDFLYFTSIRTR
jgi:hypothetical protein